MIHPYQHPLYAACFADSYKALHLPQADTHVLLRPIVDSEALDAMGVYPLCPIAPNANLTQDFALLREQHIVSLVLVADPFMCPPLDNLYGLFDHHVPFKEHYLCDMRKEHRYSKHHRYEVRRAHKACEVRVLTLRQHLDAWYGLYDQLILKHNMSGIQAFPKRYFAALCALEPIMIGAFADGELVSAHLWLRYGTYAYSHLAASSEKGYALRAAYAVYDASITHLREAGVEIVDLGGGAGTQASAGLRFLKEGFSNDRVMCHLFGKILDEARYAALSAGKPADGFFPAYRAG